MSAAEAPQIIERDEGGNEHFSGSYSPSYLQKWFSHEDCFHTGFLVEHQEHFFSAFFPKNDGIVMAVFLEKDEQVRKSGDKQVWGGFRGFWLNPKCKYYLCFLAHTFDF